MSSRRVPKLHGTYILGDINDGTLSRTKSYPQGTIGVATTPRSYTSFVSDFASGLASETTQVVKLYAGELYASGIKTCLERLANDINDSDTSALGVTGRIADALSATCTAILTGADPMFWVKSLYKTLIAGLAQDGFITKDQAKKFNIDIEMAFALLGFVQLMLDMKEVTRLLQDPPPLTRSLVFDRRYNSYKQLVKLMSDGFQSTSLTVSQNLTR